MEIDFPDKGRAFPRYLFECIINFYNDNKTKYVWALLWEQEQANIRTDFDKYEIPQDVSDYVLSLKTNKEQGTYIGDGYDDLSRFLIAYHATGNSQAGEVPDEVRYSFFKSTRGFDYSSLAKFLLDKIAPDVFYKKQVFRYEYKQTILPEPTGTQYCNFANGRVNKKVNIVTGVTLLTHPIDLLAT